MQAYVPIVTNAAVIIIHFRPPECQRQLSCKEELSDAISSILYMSKHPKCRMQNAGDGRC